MKFEYEVDAELVPADYHAFEAVRRLDPHYYAQVPKATIELGYIKSGCCRRMVRAIVEKGMVTRMEVEPCHDDDKKPSDLVKKLNLAELREKLPKRADPPPLPMPLGKFLEEPPYQWWTCIRICVFGFICFYCCYGEDIKSWQFCDPLEFARPES